MTASMPETHYARSGDVHIAYQVFGDGPLDLIVIPGAWSHVEMGWEQSAPMLERFGSFARVAVFDKRGTGLSDRNVGIAPLEERMDDTRAVMDACKMESASIVGFSEGGPMSLLFAATFPERVRSLVVYGCSPVWRSAPEIPGSAKAAKFATEVLEGIESAWGTAEGWHYWVGRELDLPELRPEVAKMWRNMVSPRDARQIIQMMQEIDVRDTLPLVTCPTLVIGASDDEIAPPEIGRWIAAEIPDARYEEVQGPHFPVRPGQLERFLDLTQEFLTGATPAVHDRRVLATLLFTDIVGSTERAAELGDRGWYEVLQSYRALVRRNLEHFRGIEVDTEGDGFLARFDGPARAVSCACAIRDGVEGLGLSVRAGVHTGEIELRGDETSGLAIHIAARVIALAAANEVVVSRTVKELVAGSGLQFDDRGTHELKGVPDTWQLYSVAGG